MWWDLPGILCALAAILLRWLWDDSRGAALVTRIGTGVPRGFFSRRLVRALARFALTYRGRESQWGRRPA
jgi:hypothetical protein